MAYKKLVKYRKDLNYPTMLYFFKSLKYRKKIIPDDKIFNSNSKFLYNFGFPLWEKDGNLYTFRNYRKIKDTKEVVIIKREDLRRLAKYINIDLVYLAHIYFATSMLAVNTIDEQNWNIIETVNNELMIPKFKNLKWYIEEKGNKYVILEKRRFIDGYSRK